jgi:hypothetical protein
MMIASLGDHTIANQREGWTFSSKSLAKVASFFFLSLEILGNAIQWYHEPSDPTPLWPLPESIPQRTNGRDGHSRASALQWWRHSCFLLEILGNAT